jgi:hypothetical protein
MTLSDCIILLLIEQHFKYFLTEIVLNPLSKTDTEEELTPITFFFKCLMEYSQFFGSD